MILGHLSVTAAGHRLLRQRWPSLPVPLGPLLLGAYLPDLVDKPIALVTGLSGRGYGHSLIVQIALFAVAGWILRRHPQVWAALALGSLLHLAQDTVVIEVLLAPLLGPVPYRPNFPWFDKILLFYTSASVLLWIEGVAVAYWICVGVRAWRPRSARAGVGALVPEPPSDPA